MIFDNRRPKRPFMANAPTRFICLSFVGAILLGTLLLMLPFSSRSSAPSVSLLDALFTATSATCVTGLIVFDTAAQWSPFGQGVILSLIQVGGLGLVTITTFLNLAVGRRLGFHSMQRAQTAISLEGGLDGIRIIRMVVKLTLLAEGAGALLLCLAFVPRYGLHGLWISVFLSVSSFCNAGFDILGFETPYGSLCAYNDNPLVLMTISALIIFGGLGFVVWHDLTQYRKTRKLMLHTRVVLLISGVLLVLGAAMFLVCEWTNPDTMAPLTSGEKLMACFFQSVTLRTAGFNSIDIAAMRPITKVLSIPLMFIGAAPGSTGGGIKVTTVAVIAMTVLSVIVGREDTVIMRRRVAKGTVYKSLAIIVLSGMAVLIAGSVVYFTIPESDIETGIDAIFEAVSAFATVGISSGLTGVATVPAKLVLIVTMFTGRVGPISLILFLAARAETGADLGKNQIMPEGKIMVG